VLSELGPATDQLLVESRDLLQRDDWRQQILEDDVRSKFEPLISQIDQLIKVSSHSPQTFLHAAATHALYLTAVNTHCRGYVFVCAQRLTKPSQPKDDAELLLELLQFFIYQAYLVGLVAVNQHLPAEEQQLEDDATTRDIMARLQQASLVDGVREQMVSAHHTLKGTFFCPHRRPTFTVSFSFFFLFLLFCWLAVNSLRRRLSTRPRCPWTRCEMSGTDR